MTKPQYQTMIIKLSARQSSKPRRKAWVGGRFNPFLSCFSILAGAILIEGMAACAPVLVTEPGSGAQSTAPVVTEKGCTLRRNLPIGRQGSKFRFGKEKVIAHQIPEDHEFNPYISSERKARYRDTDPGGRRKDQSLAQALSSARELANSLDLPRSSRYMETNLRWPVHWLRNHRAVIYKPLDNAREIQIVEMTNMVLVPRIQAIKFMLDDWDDYWHFGQIPADLERESYRGCDTNDARRTILSIFSGKADVSSTTLTDPRTWCAAASVCPI